MVKYIIQLYLAYSFSEIEIDIVNNVYSLHSVKARVAFVPTHQYIPRGLQGMIKCHVLANPPVQFVTWTKNKRIYDPFDEQGVMALPNGTILIDKVQKCWDNDLQYSKHIQNKRW